MVQDLLPLWLHLSWKNGCNPLGLGAGQLKSSALRCHICVQRNLPPGWKPNLKAKARTFFVAGPEDPEEPSVIPASPGSSWFQLGEPGYGIQFKAFLGVYVVRVWGVGVVGFLLPLL